MAEQKLVPGKNGPTGQGPVGKSGPSGQGPTGLHGRTPGVGPTLSEDVIETGRILRELAGYVKDDGSLTEAGKAVIIDWERSERA